MQYKKNNVKEEKFTILDEHALEGWDRLAKDAQTIDNYAYIQQLLLPPAIRKNISSHGKKKYYRWFNAKFH